MRGRVLKGGGFRDPLLSDVAVSVPCSRTSPACYSIGHNNDATVGGLPNGRPTTRALVPLRTVYGGGVRWGVMARLKENLDNAQERPFVTQPGYKPKVGAGTSSRRL